MNESLDLLKPLFESPAITDLVVSGFEVAAAKTAGRWHKVPSPFSCDEQMRDWIIDVFESKGVALNYKNPMGSIVVDDFRLHGVLAHGVSTCAHLTVRRLAAETASIDLFVHSPISQFRFEQIASAMVSGQSVLIAGGAGVGKTTLLRALLNRLVGLRIVTIEDTPELQLNSSGAVALISRDANHEGTGEIGLERLLSEALRMSPDRIAVGEVRGVELALMLEALNTGHSGAGATIHANSLSDLAARLEALGLRAGLAEATLAKQVVAGFGLAVLVSRRATYEISEIAKPSVVNGRLEFQRVA